MLWDTISTAILFFAYWETYCVVIGYIVVSWFPKICAGMMLSSDSPKSPALFMILTFVLTPVMECTAMILAVMTLSPIILGFSDDAAWSIGWQVFHFAPWGLAKMVGIVLLAQIILAFVPIIGRITAIHTLIIGGIVLIATLGMIQGFAPEIIPDELRWFPGWGALIVWILLCAVMTMCIAGLSGGIGAMVSRGDESSGQFFAYIGGTVAGFMPVFLYGAWLGMQIHGAG